MKEKNDLLLDQVYFLVTFYDSKLTMPSIQTYVFVGINILPGNDENGGDDCYFQEPESYLEYGNFATLLKEQRGGVLDREEVIIINSKNLDCISDYEELCNILKSTKDGTILTKPPV